MVDGEVMFSSVLLPVRPHQLLPHRPSDNLFNHNVTMVKGSVVDDCQPSAMDDGIIHPLSSTKTLLRKTFCKLIQHIKRKFIHQKA